MQDIIYFELNNWFPDRDYPNKQPYLTWMADRILTLADPDFAKTHNLVVLACQLDMSVNFCVTAPRTFVEAYCPTLLAEDSRFLRHPDSQGKIYGRFNHEFLPYTSPDYIGSVWWLPNNYGYDPQWIMKRYEENQKQLLFPIKNRNLHDFLQNIVGKNLYYYFSEDINVEDLWDDYPSKDDMPYEDFAQEITALEHRILENGKPRYPQDLVKAIKN